MKKILTISLALLALGACQNQPTSLIVSPPMHTPSTLSLQGQSATLQVIDNRSHSYISKVTEGEDKHTVFSASQPVTTTIHSIVEKKWKDAGMQFGGSESQITVYVDKFVTSINESTVSHMAETEASLRVVVKKNANTLELSYSAKGSQEGALSADNATMERQLNKYLELALNQLINDKKINEFLKRN